MEEGRLAGHCTSQQHCHGGVRVPRFLKMKRAGIGRVTAVALPPSDEQALGSGSARRADGSGAAVAEALRLASVPPGQPAVVIHFTLSEVRRGDSFQIEGGLCSPDLWTPGRRFPPSGLAFKLHDAFQAEL